jgi:GH25 family lysozyme M1 (1,4-beta-N-acetylmuramidase)
MWPLHSPQLRKTVLRVGVGVAMVAALSVAAVAGTAAVSSAGRNRPVSSALKHHRYRQRVNHFNVGATHSPRVLHMLAGSSGNREKGGPEDSQASTRESALSGALQGVDVAAYQHPNGEAINWKRVARSGIQFAAIKATEGTYYRNPYALSDLAGARAAGLSVMAYVFAVPNGNGGSASPVAQADYLIKYLDSGSGRLPPIMLDIEYNPYGAECYGLSRSSMVWWIDRFSDTILARTGENPIIYGPIFWWQDCAGSTSRFSQFPLWVPDYTSAPNPEVTPGWRTYGFWQYSSVGVVRGINASGNTDLDQLNPADIPLLDPGTQLSMTGGGANLQLKPADRVKGQTLSYSAADLPPGTTINPTGQVTGWPVTTGKYEATVGVSNSKGQSGSVAFGWNVTPAPSTGPTGPVQLELSGQCLTAAGGGSADGAQAEIRACTSNSAQSWTYAQDGTLRINNRCLTIPTMAQGAVTELEPCTSESGQQWHLAYPRAMNPALGKRWTALINLRSGMCLADPHFSETAGTKMVLWPCNGYTNESWTLPAGPVTSQIPGMCLDDSGDQTANKTKIDIFGCNGTAGQVWLAESDGTVRVNSKCLDVVHAATAPGSEVDLHSCNGTLAQQWKLVPQGAGVTLVNLRSGLCLADPGDTTTAGTQLVISTCVASDPGMSWRVS